MASTMTNFAIERAAMVERQLRRRGISEQPILDAFMEVPREAFISEDCAGIAYDDRPLPIGSGQTISQPYVVALMIQAAGVKRSDRVLEVGAGSGYAAALLGRIAAEVIAIERVAEFVPAARERMSRLGYDNVRIVHGDGTLGLPEEAPFDVILAAASGSHVPDTLIQQLAPGGRLVMPVGDPGWVQNLVKVTRGPMDRLISEDLGAVRFVPLIGAEA